MVTMSINLDETARRFVRRLEDKEAERRGASIARVRGDVATAVGLAPGTLENLRKSRTKGVRARVYMALRVAMVALLKQELAALLDEFQGICADGIPLDVDEAQEVRASIAAISAALKEAAK